MSWGRIVILDSELDTKVFEFMVIELLSIIRYQWFWDPELADYGSQNKVAYLLLGDYFQWLGLCSFGEEVHSYNGEFALTSSNGQGLMIEVSGSAGIWEILAWS